MPLAVLLPAIDSLMSICFAYNELASDESRLLNLAVTDYLIIVEEVGDPTSKKDTSGI